MSEAIDALGRHLGIDPVTGIGAPPQETIRLQRALLAGFGHVLNPGHEDEDALACLERLGASAASTPLPALMVLDAEADTQVLTPLLPADLAGKPIPWRITLEDGSERRGVSIAGSPANEEQAAPDFAGDLAASLQMPLTLAVRLPPGQHQLSLFNPGPASRLLATSSLVLCPPTCFDPAEASGSRPLWGITVELDALRSPRDWGVGDFGDLRRLIDIAADAGAHFVGVNPLHACCPQDPERYLPWRPSHREWLNVLYLDIEAIREFAESAEARNRVASPEFAARLQALREQPVVDSAAVAAAKLEVLELLYRHFRANHLDRSTQDAGLFRDFQREGGSSLRLHALFEALQEHLRIRDPQLCGWSSWPAAYRDAGSPEVEAFALENEVRIEFFEYLQWLADAQLHMVALRARARGMRIGLYRQMAAGPDPEGSETWAGPALFAHGILTRANAADAEEPGVAPWIPQQLGEAAYAAFGAVLKANMRHAGALHVGSIAGLIRSFWSPVVEQGAGVVGAWVDYPSEDLFRLLCLESRRQRCIVTGRNSGAESAELRHAMARHEVLSYSPLHVGGAAEERSLPPPGWPGRLLAMAGLDPLCRTGAGERRDGGTVAQSNAGLSERQIAEYRFIARSPAVLAVVHLGDLLDEGGPQPALQRRRLSAELADIAPHPAWNALAGLMNAERRSPALPVSGGPRDFHPELAQIPRATYRLQFHGDFGFDSASAVLPYLAELGISHIYAAPFLKARPGSKHGYDIVDHRAVNPELGGAHDFDRYCERLAGLGLSQVMDVVPNHVGVLGADNEWWLDILENGPSSEFADHFDIDWKPPFSELHDKVLLPVLGDQYGRVLEAGELKLAFSAERGEFDVLYFEHRFPIDPCDYPLILAAGRAPEGDAAAPAATADVESETLLAALRNLPPRNVTDPALQAERRHNKEVFKKHLSELHARLPSLRARIEECLAAFNGDPGEAASFDALDALLARQAYRLASWRVAADDINYRRFFDINDLAALRIENDAVFEVTHAQIFQWLADGRVTGLRIDHPDGLSDPARYFERLQERYAQIRREAAGATPDEESAAPATLYIVVEKIMGEFEPLPADWPVHGGTGYRFANWCNNLFVDAAQEARFSRVYRAFTGEARDFSEVLREARHIIMTHSLPGELGSLALLLHDIAQRDRKTRDFTRSRLRGALTEIVASFPVYRTYIGPGGISDNDRRFIERAVEEAAERGLAGDASVLHFVRDVLFSAPTEPEPELRALKLKFARRFQQFTSPVMAKSMEDTAFYRYNRLSSLNDVGGDPRTFGMTVEEFHAANERVSCTHPFGMLASSTHDSKRSEDVRTRIDVLSELPGAWRLALRRWGQINQRRKTRVGDDLAPSRNDEYLLYQTLVGAWPMTPPDEAGIAALVQRIVDYMLKAAREAKQHTSWMNPDPQYEAALTAFVRRLLLPGAGREHFLEDFLPFQSVVARFGCFNSLNMVLLKLTVPGVPDIYQGCELWNLSLVDPDNRRPVDFALAAARLRQTREEFPDGPQPQALRRLVDDMSDGRIKQYLLWRCVEVRRQYLAPLRQGRYLQLDVDGPAAMHVVAFARVAEGESVVVIASRLLFGLTGGAPERVCDPALWAGTHVTLPWRRGGGRWRNAFCGREVQPLRLGNRDRIELATLFDILPLALLVPDGAAPGAET